VIKSIKERGYLVVAVSKHVDVVLSRAGICAVVGGTRARNSGHMGVLKYDIVSV